MARSIFRVTPLFFHKHMFPTCPQNVDTFMTDRCKRGFTLIELLIVVVIIGILAAIAIPKFSTVRERAYRAAMMSDLKNLAQLQEVYHNSTFSYGSTLSLVEGVSSEGVTLTINEATGSGWAATASHLALTGKQCGIYHGSATAANGSPATVQGVVTCSF